MIYKKKIGDTTFVGHASKYFEKLYNDKKPHYAKAFYTQSMFSAPEKEPLILIGPGTGLAPFIGFVEEKKNILLYFGCRHKDKDYIMKDLLEDSKAKGIIKLRTAFSRDQEKKIYVQDLLKEDGDEIAQWVTEKNATIMVCGSIEMGKSIQGVINSILSKHAISIEKMGKRFQMELWG